MNNDRLGNLRVCNLALKVMDMIDNRSRGFTPLSKLQEVANNKRDLNGEPLLSDSEVLDRIYYFCEALVEHIDNSQETRNVDLDDHEYHNQRLREIERGQ